MTTYDISTASPPGLTELKQAHRKTWASGNYGNVAERIVNEVPPRHLLERVSIEPGMEVLDIAAGTGNVAIPAAQLGARVTALDLTPELFERGRERAAEAGVEIDWVQGDAEDLPFEHGRFDVVLSTFGIQFAPRHEAAAQEAARVTRDGGTIGLINWTPQSHIGQVLKTVGSRLPKPPDYASPPALWGYQAHVRELFESTGVELEFERAMNPFVGFDSPEDWVEFMEANYGPLITAREKLSADTWAEVHRELIDLTTSLDQGAPGALRVESEYLLTLGRRAAA
jgi:SAM-dependent methyltransferase